MIRLVSTCVAVISACTYAVAVAQTLDDARNQGLAWLIKAQRNDGSWGAKPESAVGTTATALQAFLSAGFNRASYPYAAGVTWLQNAKPESTDSLARQMISFPLSGPASQEKLAKLEAVRNVFGGWGAYPGFDTSYPDTALVLAAFRASGNWFWDTATTVYCEMLPGQLADGGWGYFNPRSSGGPTGISASALVPTAYNIVELKAINVGRGWDSQSCATTAVSSSIVAALNGARSFLLTKKNADGGFGAGGVSAVMDTALAYWALRSLDPADANAAGALSWLLAHQDATSTPARGSWGSDVFETALVLMVLPAPSAALADTDGDGIPDGVEVALGTNPNVKDSMSLAQLGGSNTLGLSVASAFSASAVQFVPFTRTLAASGGLPPYSWAIPLGALPSGLMLNTSNGTISGTANSPGNYTFTVAVTDTLGTTVYFPGTITVTSNNQMLQVLFLLLNDD